ncbi:MAG TPA: TonB-dependent receptor family protein [Parafilimonas sp.]|nr:TonB-dependent receptor family protein [Parafilimonas sp.]
MKALLLFTQLIFISLFLSAQNSPVSTISFSGVTVDSLGKPAPGATVEITGNNIRKADVSNMDGSFSVDKLPVAKEYTLTVTAIGFGKLSKKIVLTPEDRRQTQKNIGNVTLISQVNTLSSVVVTASAAPAMQFGIDRKVFNVEKNITAQGGSAVDVLRNIPSLSVDVNGNVQLRNSPPQIFIDGRPTILTLDQIPADDIEKVELITNPSAKYDASGGGIINIVMKKNKRTGLNGIASMGVGSPEILNGSLNLNYRQNDFNFFATGNFNNSGGVRKEETYRANKTNDVITDYFNQSSENNTTRKFNSVRFGVDYFIDKNNTISLVQSFNHGNFLNDEIQNQQYLDEHETLNYTGLRTTNGNGTFKRSSSRLSFETKFKRPEHNLTADITYNKGSRTDNSNIFNSFSYPDGSIYAPDNNVRNSGLSDDYQVIGQVDYSNKINESKRIELGIRSYYNNSTSNFATYAIDEADNETKLPLSNNYKYTEKVNAGYFNYANKWRSLTYQVGLRVELSDFDGYLVDSNYHFGYKFPDGFKDLAYAIFPSVFITQPLSENQDLQINYSKRIRRPRFWEVNPFVDITDPMNIRVGNPALKPEYINSFELNYFNRFNENSGSFLASVYFHNNVGDVTQYSDTITPALYEKLNNAAISPDAIVNTFINAGYTNRMGAEFTLQKKFWKNLDLMLNLDMQYRDTKATVNEIDLSNSGFNFETNLIANYRIVTKQSDLFNNLSFQLTADYEGPAVIPQGKTKQRFASDFAMRKEFLKRKASISFSINDIFNTRKFGTIYDTDAFYQDSYRRWNVRSFRVTFSYKFGKTDINLFKRKNNIENNDDNEGGPGEG